MATAYLKYSTRQAMDRERCAEGVVVVVMKKKIKISGSLHQYGALNVVLQCWDLYNSFNIFLTNNIKQKGQTHDIKEHYFDFNNKKIKT